MEFSYLLWVVVIGTSIWVYFDAKAIGVKKGQVKGIADMGAWGWLLACFLLWIVAFPLYLGNREKFKKVNEFPALFDVSSIVPNIQLSPLDVNNYLTPGIAALKSGNIHVARQLFDGAIRQDPNDERTWGWFYYVCENDGERIQCLRELLRINPNNEAATIKLSELLSPNRLFTTSKQQIATSVQLSQTVKKEGKKGLATWEKILLPILIVTALIVICVVVAMISVNFINY
jgi:hypothetical protein